MIESGRVTLRRVEPDDYPAIQRWQNDPEVAQWMNYDRRFSLDDIKRSEEQAAGEGHPFIIEADGTPIGRVGLNNLRPRDGMASAYILIGERDYWGQRLGHDAMHGLLGFGFNILNLRKIELWLIDTNERALRMYKAVGFVEEARLPERNFFLDRYVDSIVMSVDRDTYLAANGAP